MSQQPIDIEPLARDLRLYVFREAAATAQIPHAPQISHALARAEPEVRAALHALELAAPLATGAPQRVPLAGNGRTLP